ncbi:N-acetyl-gamma-glutamyl-phosphate reductase [Ruminiclostridium cellobioparum]|uniref:N-acetyl-gamma-glutamyl-phosphate reductase n=1 Tax=Ruminiclostridium cellobioparum subsp. termitidis CT1112 TaxID=1195236 RepID=S0FKN3_RUMCE|nr:N-acetyl-gamma-glutamyl-phosphate reductase [Ruminiclostridium cellobioparum]EMS70856.1 N-acetyl-gamma-glutamyl-phosphate reductase, uncommon form [Ruminiclostridium cellobioparum subsp. termitidis CT1112]
MKFKVFVDGSEGTTGLQINERLAARNDLYILKIDAEKRKDINERKKCLNQADVVFLCLPDAAAAEAVSLIDNPATRVIDASTAHRTNSDWAYGLPELSRHHRSKIESSARVSVPGCYATGFISLIYPLVSEGLVQKDYPVTAHAISGYSGGGKKLIAQFEAPDGNPFESPQLYALDLTHKHIPEMTVISGLKYAPLFSPIVCPYYKGMSVCVPVYPRLLQKPLSKEDIHGFLTDYYSREKFIKVMPLGTEKEYINNFIGATRVNNTNYIEIYVTGNTDQIMLVSVLDNLGKGSSGAAIQNMNIMLGLREDTGLI